MKSYTILGIDPGILNTGLAIVTGNSDYKLIASEHVKTDPKSTLGSRLAKIQVAINEIIQFQAIDAIAIEKCFHNRNVASSATTQQVIGAVHIVAHTRNLPIIELTPQQVKKASGLSTKANKENLIRAAKGIFNSQIKSHHTADAALCALGGILQTRCNHGKTT